MARGRNPEEVVEMVDPVDPAVDPTANGETKRTRRSTPEGEEISLDELENMSTRSKGGPWFERAKWFRDNPGQVKVYRAVSPSMATHLKKNHGLQAATRNTRDNGKTADLVVGYFPEGYELPKIFKGREKKD